MTDRRGIHDRVSSELDPHSYRAEQFEYRHSNYNSAHCGETEVTNTAVTHSRNEKERGAGQKLQKESRVNNAMLPCCIGLSAVGWSQFRSVALFARLPYYTVYVPHLSLSFRLYATAVHGNLGLPQCQQQQQQQQKTAVHRYVKVRTFISARLCPR